MQNNLISMANSNKIKNNAKTLTIDNSKYVKEELIPEDADATTIGDSDHKVKETKKTKDYFAPNKETKESKDYFAPNEDSEEDEKVVNDRFNDIKSNDNKDEQAKAHIRRNIKKMRCKAGITIPPDLENNSLHELKDIEQSAKNVMKKRRKALFYWQILYMCCWAFESGITRFGYGLRSNGWAEKIKESQSEYMVYINEILMDTVYVDSKTGERVVIKNTSFLSNIEISPTVNLVFALIMSYVSHITMSNIWNLTKVKNNMFGSNKTDDEDAMMKLEIPEEAAEDSNKFSYE